jgi:hypothetical protein
MGSWHCEGHVFAAGAGLCRDDESMDDLGFRGCEMDDDGGRL